MKKYMQTMILGAGILGSTLAQAEISGEISLTSDYRFRGVSQSAEEAAIQGGLEYFHDSGVYAGWWGSSVDYAEAGSAWDNNESVEHDLYIGYYGELSESVTYDATLYRYIYPGTVSDVDYTELNLGLNYNDLRLSYWYADDYFGLGEDYSYIELDYTFELPEEFSLTLHGGYSFGGVFDDPNTLGLEEYADYSIKLNKNVAGLDLSLAYMDTDIDSAYAVSDNHNANESAVVFSVTKGF